MIASLVAAGAAASLQIGMRPWHEEHRIRTSGIEMAKLAEAVQERGIRAAFAPYEIQWRLMFATDESVLVSSLGISPGAEPGRSSRYPHYDEAVLKMDRRGRGIRVHLPAGFRLRGVGGAGTHGIHHARHLAGRLPARGDFTGGDSGRARSSGYSIR